jgi:hypothetical protein
MPGQSALELLLDILFLCEGSAESQFPDVVRSREES